MVDQWRNLLNQASLDTLEDIHHTWVICCYDTNTLQDFMRQYCQVEIDLAMITPLGYFNTHIISDNKKIDLSIYVLSLPSDKKLTGILNIFLKNIDIKTLKWIIIINWISDNKNRWLRDLNDLFTSIKINNLPFDVGSASLAIMNSSYTQNLEINTTIWNSKKMDFIYQSLRSICFCNGCSLIALDPEDISSYALKFSSLVFEHICMDNKKIEMVNLQELFIPHGADSIGKIKTLDDGFPVQDVTTEVFIDYFETLIPDEGEKWEQCNEGYNHEDRSCFFYDWKDNAQRELSKLFNLHRFTQEKTFHSFQSLPSRDHNLLLSTDLNEQRVNPNFNSKPEHSSDTKNDDFLDGFVDDIVQKNRNFV